ARTQCAMFAALVLLAAVEYKAFGTSKRFNASSSQPMGIRDDGFIALNSEAYHEMISHPQYRVAVDATGPGAPFIRAWGATTPQGFDPLLPAQYREMVGAAAFRTNREFDVDPTDDAALHLFGVRYFITADSAAAYKKIAGNSRFKLIGSDRMYFKTFEYLD